jgi:hypothetical protein|tara:strand:+ start:589 stop:843 length:255 start_codon:yes stop_codon:yes gene_type:complete
MSEKDRFNIVIHRTYRITQTVYADSPREAEDIGEELQQEIDDRFVLSQWTPEFENRHPNTRVKIEPYITSSVPVIEIFFNEEEE